MCLSQKLILLVTLLILPAAAAGDTNLLKLRAGHHDGFIRIVLEGPESVISTGTVKQQGQDILVNFNEANFTLQADKVSVAYIKDKNSINFTPGEFRSFKSFSLQDPGRLIIDVFDKKDVNPAQNSKPVNNPPSRQNIKAISAEDNNRKTGMPEENKTSISQSVTKVNVNVIPEKSRIQKTEGLDSGSRGNEGLEALSGEKNSKNKPVAAPESLHVASEEPAQVATQNPEHLNADKFSGNKNLAASHLASADKFYQAKDYINAIVHLNLAAVYSDSEGQRELLFLKRAELYFKAGYFYEARDNYSIFLKRFTSSKLSVNANLGLAKSLEKLGSYEEAAVYFDKSGKSAEALFGKANTLQRSGKIQEANAAYNDALLTDSAYPERLPETCYLLGENLRLSGKKEDARQYFEKIKNGLFNDSAKISLGLMAKEDLKQEEAMKYFKEASESKDRNLRAQALFNLAMISLQTGRQADALSMLQKIREKYPYTPPYKEAVLELSKLYKKDGKLNESVSVLKELVTTKNPTEAALDELQSYLMDTVKSDAAQFVKQWNELGRYLMDRSREQFLLGMAEALKGKGTPFLDLSAWLAQNGSEDAKMQTAFVLAGFFADMNETDTARKYLGLVKNSKNFKDPAARIEAKIDYVSSELESAAGKIMSMKEISSGDIELLGRILSNSDISGSKIMQKALAYYEKQIDALQGNNEDYVRLADILYTNNKVDKAVSLYRAAYEGGIKDDWAMYRIGINSGKDEAEKIFAELQKNDSTLSRMVKARQMEMDIRNRLAEVF